MALFTVQLVVPELPEYGRKALLSLGGFVSDTLAEDADLIAGGAGRSASVTY
jgi:hypothetical protein